MNRESESELVDKESESVVEADPSPQDNMEDDTFESTDFNCSICHKSFSKRSNLKRHEREKHTSHHQVHECKACRKSYKRLSDLSRHMKASHSEEGGEQMINETKKVSKRNNHS